MKRKVFVMLVGVMLLAGLLSCSAIRENLVTISNEDIKNAETTRIVAKNFLSTWKINSGFIKGVMGIKINEFPATVLTAMDELDTLSNKQDLNDYDLGYSLGIRIRMLSTFVQEAIKLYAPEVLKYIPTLFVL